MKVFTSDTHRAELSTEGILDVFLVEGRKILETSFDGDNVRVEEHTAKEGSPVLRKLLDVMDTQPVLRAAFAKYNVFHVDYETGTQRWKGYKTTQEVRHALIGCGFKINDIYDMIATCEKTTHEMLPKVK